MPLTVTLLSLCQALLVTGNVLLIAVSPLIGASIWPLARHGRQRLSLPSGWG